MTFARKIYPMPIAAQGMSRRATPAFGDLVVEYLPQLRTFARSLTGRDGADDLVQDAVARALPAERSFTPGTNMGASLFTILRNVHRSNFRRGRLELGSIDTVAEGYLATPPRQIDHLELAEVGHSLQLLPAGYRKALLLIGTMGMNYQEAAAAMGCPIGTAKSRVNRARAELTRLRGGGPAMPHRVASPARAAAELRRRGGLAALSRRFPPEPLGALGIA